MDQAWLEAASLVVAISVWWLGIRRVELTSAAKSVVSALELGLLIASVVALRWLGLGIFVAANCVGILVYSVKLAMQKEAILVEVSNRCGSSKDEVYEVHARLSTSDALRWVGPIRLAEWMRQLAYRNRTLAEIEAIAPTIGKLSLVFGEPDPEWLILKFDQILRLNRESASNAASVAETLYGIVNASAATFEEMIEALIAAATPI